MRKASIGMLIGLLCILLFSYCPQAEITGARVRMNQGDYDKAIELCQIAIDKMPNNPDAYFELGRAYGFKKMYHEMNEAFTKSLEFGSTYAKDIENHRKKYWADVFNEGVNAIRQEKLDKAIEAFALGIELAPTEKDTYKNLAVAYAQNSEDEKAIEVYENALKAIPGDMELIFNLGIMNYHGKRYEKAIEILRGVTSEADPTTKEYSDALYYIAYSYDLIGEPDSAIAAYKEAFEKNPNDKDLLFNLGRLYYMREDFENAIVNFKKVLELDSEDFDANLNIGTAYNRMEKFSDAIPFFQKAIEIDPNNQSAWFNIGIAYVRTGNSTEGEAAFKKADDLKAVEE